MSSKRRSDYQITKEPSQSSVSDDEADPHDIPRKASAQTMARRKIIQLNPRRNIKPQGNPSLSLPAANPFSSVNHESKVQTPIADSSTKNPFSFLGKQSANSSSISSNSITKEVDDSKLKRRALNEKFADKITQLKLTNVYSDWSTILEAYLKFSKEISQDVSQDQKSSAQVTTSTNPVTSSNGSLTKSAGLSFGFASQPSTTRSQSTTSTPLAFNFGSENKSSIASSSAFDNTPQFTIPSMNSNVDTSNKFAALQKEEKPKEQNSDTVMIEDSDSESSDEDIEIKGPKFVLEKPLLTNNSPFNFNKKDTSESSVDSGFRFKPPEKNTKSVFKFNAPPVKLAGSEDTQKIKIQDENEKTIEKAITKENETSTSDSNKSFTFGAKTDTQMNALSGTSNNSTTKPFSFGASSSDVKDKSAAKSFSFGGPAASPHVEETKTMTNNSFFGNTIAKSDSKETEKPAFSFGSSTSSCSPFTFGSPTNKNESAGQFKFGNTDATNTATTGTNTSTPFKFGEASKSAFSFGAPSTGKDHTWSPDKGIKFGGSEGSKSLFGSGPSFGQSAGFTFGSAPASNTTSTEQKTTEVETEETEKPEAQVDLSSQGAGEENEECVYEKKAKIFELTGGEYKVLGVGPLRVLSDKGTRKTRILVRAEGSGRVILNTLLKKQVKYTMEGKNQVKVIDFKADGTPTTYMIRVKTGTDSEELKNKLEEFKKNG